MLLSYSGSVWMEYVDLRLLVLSNNANAICYSLLFLSGVIKYMYPRQLYLYYSALVLYVSSTDCYISYLNLGSVTISCNDCFWCCL